MLDQPYGQMSMQGVDPLQGKRFFVRKRDGRRQEFNEARIYLAIESAFRATLGIDPNESLRDILQIEIKNITDPIVQGVLARAVHGQELEVEAIQDAVEEQLMRAGHLAVARRYILYRDERRRARVTREKQLALSELAQMPDLEIPTAPPRQADAEPFRSGLYASLASPDIEEPGPDDDLVNEGEQDPPASPTEEPEEFDAAPVPESAPSTSRTPFDPALDRTKARLLLKRIYKEAWPDANDHADPAETQRDEFGDYLGAAVNNQLIARAMLHFDLRMLAEELRLERDEQFNYEGLQSLFDNYLLRVNGQCIETPQYFWMRLAMGLALNEGPAREVRALEFYEALSTFRFVPSREILAGAGCNDPRLITVYRTSGWNDLEHVKTEPGGVAVEQRGLNRAWLEPWHTGIGEFLKRPRRNEDPWEQDLGKGIWVPDLFVKRVRENRHWTLFNPSDTPDLHGLHGRAFERRYQEYELRAERGELPAGRRLASSLWAEMLESLSETGQPWLAFKDAANVRSMHGVVDAVQNGSLYGDVLLNGGADRISVCSTGAINLGRHVKEGELDEGALEQTVESAIRMLDNALDLAVYPCETSRRAVFEYRPVGLGIVGFHEMLRELGLAEASSAAVEWADRSMEAVSYFALLASSELARISGAYPAFAGSKWKLGILPIDTLAMIEKERGVALEIDRSSQQDWAAIRDAVRLRGIRNCATTAITPAQEASLIMGVSTPAEADPHWLIECAARRQKWLDMSQALQLNLNGMELKQAGSLFLLAWEKGLKSVSQSAVPLAEFNEAVKPESVHEDAEEKIHFHGV